MSETAMTVPNFRKTESSKFGSYAKAKAALDSLNQKLGSTPDKRARVRRRSDGSFDLILYVRPTTSPKAQK